VRCSRPGTDFQSLVVDQAYDPTPTVWKVNDVQGGNDKWGTIRAEAEDDAVYTAPAKLPPTNPVTVSCETTGKHAKIIATSLITVIQTQSREAAR
jgi:hypothetical protein